MKGALIVASIEKIPPQVEAKYRKFIQARELLEKVSQEKALLEASLAEIDSVIEELNSLPDNAEVYRMKGVVLVKVEKNEALKDLNSKKESIELKLMALRRQEETLQKEVERLGRELNQMLAGGGGAPVGGAG